MPTVDEFAGITKKVIERDGFENYLPTALYPSRRHIVVLEDVPEDADLEPIALEWAATGAIAGEEFLVAFKVGSTTFKVIRRFAGGQEEAVFDIGDVSR
jgi:hypothetical protein